MGFFSSAIPGWKHIRKYKKLLVLSLFFAMINQFFSLLDPLIFRLLIDDYATKLGELSNEEFVNGVLFLVLASVGVAFVSRVGKNIQEYYVSVVTQKVGTSMYTSSVDHTFSLPYAVFEDRRSGEILQKLQKARSDTQGMMESLIGTVFLSLIGIIFVLVYSFTVHWVIGFVFLLMIPLLGFFTFWMSTRIKKAQKTIVLESAELAGSTTETIRNVELVKSMGLEKQEINRLNALTEKILGLEIKKVKLVRVLSFIQGTSINTLRSGLLLLMLWFIYTGEMTLGSLFSLLFYSFFIFGPLTDLGRVAQQFQEAKASNEALDEILSIPPQKKPDNPQKIGRMNEIVFENVSFHYNSNDSPSLDSVSLSIKAGETVAFVGESGSGKTTLSKLLVGLYSPAKGKLLFNDVNSKNIDFDFLHSRIGLVAQETQLFAGTIRENLLFVNPSASDEQCLSVLHQANIDSILKREKKGLNTKIGEGGIKLSGGERQRLAIARALLRNPDLIVFDEATSSLDSITEKAITDTIKKIKEKRKDLIFVLIAHRLSTITHADHIFVLQNGKIVEKGNHSSLLKKNGLYAAFWKQQTGE